MASSFIIINVYRSWDSQDGSLETETQGGNWLTQVYLEKGR